ncbi:excinuclease ABC subunit C [Pukyongia salina]|uniref:Excinuclease ABC subunit C n=1 Tax=Pukyongia salina TaxID=2094025 RepID=A0A2S0I0B0_9FLAO|nr:GIY-YIG nuclease family protein [Pukyongia salina]AVI52342.1 excinuclease ABC subunit C [Pukyongia salina]
MVLPYCVYVLQSERDLLLYHGFTTNLQKRLIDHNKGGTISTAKRRPLKLVYCEFFFSRVDAIRREKYFKTTAGKRMLKLMLRDTLLQIKYPK